MESFALFLVKGINYVVPDRFAISTERVAKAMIAEAVHAKEQGFDLESPQVQVWDNKAIADSA